MKCPTRIYCTETDKAWMWDRWQKGESLNSIARHFGRSHSSIQGVLARRAGAAALKRTPESMNLHSGLNIGVQSKKVRRVVMVLYLN